jgi:hypothetical protein
MVEKGYLQVVRFMMIQSPSDLAIQSEGVDCLNHLATPEENGEKMVEMGCFELLHAAVKSSTVQESRQKAERLVVSATSTVLLLIGTGTGSDSK